MMTHGHHLLLDVWLLEDVTDVLVTTLESYVRRNFTVVAKARKEFKPFGLTSVLVLSESHFTIHTYPEHRYVSMDLYICRPELDLARVRDDLLALLRVEWHESSCVVRGLRPDHE